MSIQLSFCTTCMGRLEHLKQTLANNIADNHKVGEVEFVLLDYSSPDGLSDWIKESFSSSIASGLLTYYMIYGREHFHMAHAKNLAHKLAAGTIVCNLDADNFTGPYFADYVIKAFAKTRRMLLRSPIVDGSHGRIAIHKNDFEMIGGYNEKLEFGWGYEDVDFINRAKAAGIEESFINDKNIFLKTIMHDSFERTRFTKIKRIRRSNVIHQNMSKECIQRGEIVANNGKIWGSGTVVKNFRETITLGLA